VAGKKGRGARSCAIRGQRITRGSGWPLTAER
jgi:hypothetical protein